MKIKLPYEKLKEILNNERIDFYLKEDLYKLYEIFKLKNLFEMKRFSSRYSNEQTIPTSSVSADTWVVMSDPISLKTNTEGLPCSFMTEDLNIKSIYFFERNKSKLAVLKDYNLTEFGIECDIDYLEEIKKNETDFKRFDEYFKKYIGDIKELDLEEEIKNARELKELEEGI